MGQQLIDFKMLNEEHAKTKEVSEKLFDYVFELSGNEVSTEEMETLNAAVAILEKLQNDYYHKTVLLYSKLKNKS